jgi:hypothetical protein
MGEEKKPETKQPFGLSVAAGAAASKPYRQWPMIIWNPYKITECHGRGGKRDEAGPAGITVKEQYHSIDFFHIRARDRN